MSQNDGIHTRLLTSAAKRVLRPLGLMQKGRSRTWLADHGWWLAVIEFQPDRWSRGSYLNVGCMWLWNVHRHLSFDVGYSINEFQPFETERQFDPIAQRLAEQARDKVAEYRDRFRTVGQVSDYYMRNPPDGFWPCFNAAIAHIMSGRMKPASVLLSQCETTEHIFSPPNGALASVQPAPELRVRRGNTSHAHVEPTAKARVDALVNNTLHIQTGAPAWLIEARQVVRTMASMASEQPRFREFITDRVRETRDLHRLPPLDHIDFGSERIIPE